jgi:hypothetical protein
MAEGAITLEEMVSSFSNIRRTVGLSRGKIFRRKKSQQCSRLVLRQIRKFRHAAFACANKVLYLLRRLLTAHVKQRRESRKDPFPLLSVADSTMSGIRLRAISVARSVSGRGRRLPPTNIDESRKQP